MIFDDGNDMPNYEDFDIVLERQTDKKFIAWLHGLKNKFHEVYSKHEPFRICEKTAKQGYDSGMTPSMCLSETFYD